ncbi:A24 family peptidase [Thermogutta sp.]|uniref:A24 family peptidase n=1 Tax=Thermogutta sp. TaxID=1962930 RepID=UPI0032200581
MLDSLIVAIAVLLVTFWAAITDLRERRIPNVLTVPAMVAGLCFHSLMPGGQGWLFSLAGFAVGAALLILPYIFGGGGMGDIKLLAALGSWLGPRGLLIAFACGVVVGSIFSLVCLVTGKSLEELVRPSTRQKQPGDVGSAGAAPSRRFNVSSRKALPFAVPLAVGTWLMVALALLRGGWY